MEEKVRLHLADVLELDGLLANYQNMLVNTSCSDKDNDARLIEIGRCECILRTIEEVLNPND